jgi:hypothetical protein
MDSVSAARARHTLTHLEARHAFAKCDDRASGRIAERHRLVEAIERGLHRVAPRLRVCALSRTCLTRSGRERALPTITFFGKLDDHALGSRGHEAGCHLDERLPLARSRHRHVFDGGFACFDVLEELFHEDQRIGGLEIGDSLRWKVYPMSECYNLRNLTYRMSF